MSCSLEGCYAPDVLCSMGEDSPLKCKHWLKTATDGGETAPAAAETEATTYSVPWSGNALGLRDLPFITGRRFPNVVGVIGPAGAGKTTLLAAWYLQLGRGQLADAGTFAGSYTLTGWENIAHSLRWSNDGGPGFPQHTASGAGRAPGLLHLALRQGDDVTDTLITDAPGEWFRSWAIERDSAEAEGARWVARHATAFVIIADGEALSGNDVGAARVNLQGLIHRVSAERSGRPVALVWAKSDLTPPAGVRSAIEGTMATHLPDAPQFAVSVYPSGEKLPEQGFGDVYRWAISAVSPPIKITQSLPVISDPLLVYGHR